jgi:hypothetical protein
LRTGKALRKHKGTGEAATPGSSCHPQGWGKTEKKLRLLEAWKGTPYLLASRRVLGSIKEGVRV